MPNLHSYDNGDAGLVASGGSAGVVDVVAELELDVVEVLVLGDHKDPHCVVHFANQNGILVSDSAADVGAIVAREDVISVEQVHVRSECIVKSQSVGLGGVSLSVCGQLVETHSPRFVVQIVCRHVLRSDMSVQGRISTVVRFFAEPIAQVCT